MGNHDPSLAYQAKAQPSPFAVLATHGPDGQLDLVPCCFAFDLSGPELEIVSAVDHKPKRSTKLARLTNIAREPQVSLLVDHRDRSDWAQLWWVRLHGRARVVEEGLEWTQAIDALVEKYEQYRKDPPAGPAIRIRPDRWVGWIPKAPGGEELDLEPT